MNRLIMTKDGLNFQKSIGRESKTYDQEQQLICENYYNHPRPSQLKLQKRCRFHVKQINSLTQRSQKNNESNSSQQLDESEFVSERVLSRMHHYDMIRKKTSGKLDKMRKERTVDDASAFFEDSGYTVLKSETRNLIDSHSDLVECQEIRYQRQILGNSSKKYFKGWQQVSKIEQKREFESSEERASRIREKMNQIKRDFKLQNQKKNYNDLKYSFNSKEREGSVIGQISSNPLFKFLLQVKPSKRVALRNMQKQLRDSLTQNS